MTLHPPADVLGLQGVTVTTARGAAGCWTEYTCHAPGLAPFSYGTMDDYGRLLLRRAEPIDWQMVARMVERERARTSPRRST